jgi:hypothetical protein
MLIWSFNERRYVEWQGVDQRTIPLICPNPIFSRKYSGTYRWRLSGRFVQVDVPPQVQKALQDGVCNYYNTPSAYLRIPGHLLRYAATGRVCRGREYLVCYGQKKEWGADTSSEPLSYWAKPLRGYRSLAFRIELKEGNRPSSTETAIPPNRLYLIAKKDLLASPSSASI